jgi:hypothetical protein
MSGSDERPVVRAADGVLGRVPEGEQVCLLELVCPECGRVTTDEHAPGCEGCQTS